MNAVKLIIVQFYRFAGFTGLIKGTAIWRSAMYYLLYLMIASVLTSINGVSICCAIEQGANVQSRHGYIDYENSHKVHVMRWCRGKSLGLRKTRNSEQAAIFCKFCNGMWRLCNKTSKMFFSNKYNGLPYIPFY